MEKKINEKKIITPRSRKGRKAKKTAPPAFCFFWDSYKNHHYSYFNSSFAWGRVLCILKKIYPKNRSKCRNSNEPAGALPGACHCKKSL